MWCFVTAVNKGDNKKVRPLWSLEIITLGINDEEKHHSIEGEQHPPIMIDSVLAYENESSSNSQIYLFIPEIIDKESCQDNIQLINTNDSYLIKLLSKDNKDKHELYLEKNDNDNTISISYERKTSPASASWIVGKDDYGTLEGFNIYPSEISQVWPDENDELAKKMKIGFTRFTLTVPPGKGISSFQFKVSSSKSVQPQILRGEFSYTISGPAYVNESILKHIAKIDDDDELHKTCKIILNSTAIMFEYVVHHLIIQTKDKRNCMMVESCNMMPYIPIEAEGNPSKYEGYLFRLRQQNIEELKFKFYLRTTNSNSCIKAKGIIL